MAEKSATCIGKMSGEPVTEYESLEEAWEGAEYANATYQSDLVPYQCSRCGLFHLAPQHRQTPSRTCRSCAGADGKPKEAYASQQDAEKRAAILRSERGVILRAYRCDYGNGWHLTKGARF
jgi:hypothetical protein